MHIVIDISDERFRDIQRIAEVQTERKHFKTAEQIVANGIPLPKGHGRLKDIDAIIDTLDSSDRDIYVKECLEEDAPTIIEADTESED